MTTFNTNTDILFVKKEKGLTTSKAHDIFQRTVQNVVERRCFEKTRDKVDGTYYFLKRTFDSDLVDTVLNECIKCIDNVRFITKRNNDLEALNHEDEDDLEYIKDRIWIRITACSGLWRKRQDAKHEKELLIAERNKLILRKEEKQNAINNLSKGKRTFQPKKGVSNLARKQKAKSSDEALSNMQTALKSSSSKKPVKRNQPKNQTQTSRQPSSSKVTGKQNKQGKNQTRTSHQPSSSKVTGKQNKKGKKLQTKKLQTSPQSPSSGSKRKSIQEKNQHDESNITKRPKRGSINDSNISQKKRNKDEEANNSKNKIKEMRTKKLRGNYIKEKSKKINESPTIEHQKDIIQHKKTNKNVKKNRKAKGDNDIDKVSHEEKGNESEKTTLEIEQVVDDSKDGNNEVEMVDTNSKPSFIEGKNDVNKSEEQDLQNKDFAEAEVDGKIIRVTSKFDGLDSKETNCNLNDIDHVDDIAGNMNEKTIVIYDENKDESKENNMDGNKSSSWKQMMLYFNEDHHFKNPVYSSQDIVKTHLNLTEKEMKETFSLKFFAAPGDGNCGIQTLLHHMNIEREMNVEIFNLENVALFRRYLSKMIMLAVMDKTVHDPNLDTYDKDYLIASLGGATNGDFFGGLYHLSNHDDYKAENLIREELWLNFDLVLPLIAFVMKRSMLVYVTKHIEEKYDQRQNYFQYIHYNPDEEKSLCRKYVLNDINAANEVKEIIKFPSTIFLKYIYRQHFDCYTPRDAIHKPKYINPNESRKTRRGKKSPITNIVPTPFSKTDLFVSEEEWRSVYDTFQKLWQQVGE